MHQPLDGAHGVVADRIVALGGIANELARVGHELARDRVARILGPDEGGERRRKADRVALGDGLELREAVPARPGPLRRDPRGWSGGGVGFLRSFGFHDKGETRAERDAVRFTGPSYGNGGEIARRARTPSRQAAMPPAPLL